MDAPEGGPQLAGKACPCPASKLWQFAPFLRARLLGKNGQTVLGGFGVDLAAAFGLALALALAALALPPPFPPPLPPLAAKVLSPRLAASACLRSSLSWEKGQESPFGQFPCSRKWKQILPAAPFPPPLAPEPAAKVLTLAAAPEGLAAASLAVELADLLLRLCQGRRGIGQLPAVVETSSAPPLGEPLLVARTQGPPCGTLPTWQGTGGPPPWHPPAISAYLGGFPSASAEAFCEGSSNRVHEPSCRGRPTRGPPPSLQRATRTDARSTAP